MLKRYRRVAVLSGGLLFFGLVLAGFYEVRKHRLDLQTARWKQDGIRADRCGDYAQAVDSLMNYLSRQPDDSEALIAYIDARPRVESPQSRNLTDTIRALRYLLQLDPALVQYRRQLLDLYVKLGLRTEALDVSGQILKDKPDDVRTLQIKTQTLLGLRRNDGAMAASRRWADADPMNVNALATKLSLLHQGGRPDSELSATVEEWGKRHPGEETRFELIKGVYFQQIGDRQNALAWLRKAAAHPLRDDSFAEVLVAQFAAIGDGGEDVGVLRKLVDGGAGAPTVHSLLFRLWELGRWREVIDVSRKIDVTGKDTPGTIAALVCMAYRNLGNATEAASLARMLSARSEATCQAWSVILGPLPPDAAAWRSLADSCNRALSADPRNVYIRYYLGESLAALGETELAIETLQIAADLNSTWGLPVARMAELLLRQGNLDQAAQAAVWAIRRAPNASAAITAARAVAMLEENGRNVDPQLLPRLIDELDKTVPGNEEVDVLRIHTYAWSGKREQAVQSMRSLLDRTTPRPSEELLLRLASIDQVGRFGLGSEILDVGVKLYGVTPELGFALALRESAAGRPREGLRVIDSASATQNPADAKNWQLVRARYLDWTSDSGAKAQWQAVSERYPKDIAVQSAVLSARATHGDRALREEAIGRLRAVLGDQSLICVLARVRLLIDTRSSDADDVEIAETLRKLIAAHPLMAEPRLLWAQRLQDAGKIDEAIDQFQMASSRNPESTSLALKLANLYRAKGDLLNAIKQVQQVEHMRNRTSAESLLTARLLAKMGEVPRAIGILEQLGEEQAPESRLFLAELYEHNKQPDMAEAITARLLAKPSAAIVEFAASRYAARGKTSEAEEALAKLGSLKLAAGEAALARASFYADTDQVDQAISQYRQATAEAPRNSVVWRSFVVFLVTHGRESESVTALDQALAALGKDPSLEQIKKTIGPLSVACRYPELRSIVRDFLDAPREAVAALDVITVVSHASAERNPAASVSLAGALNQRYPQWEGVRLWAIRTFLGAGRISEAGQMVARAVEAFPASSEVAAVAASFYATQRRWTEMLDAANHWHEISTESLGADAAVARALVGLDRAEDAAARLQPDIAKAKADPDGYVELLSTYADALRATGHVDAAADLLLALARARPYWRLPYLQFATTKLSQPEARDWLIAIEPSIDNGSIDQVLMLAKAWAAVATRPGATAGDRKKAGQLFAALRSRPDAFGETLEQAAMFSEQSGETSDAIALYRLALAKDHDRPVAHNNLAILLAGERANRDEAIRQATAAVEARPAEPEFLDTLATIQAKFGDTASAIDTVRRAVEIDPPNPRWRIALIQLLFDSGHTDQAGQMLAAMDSMALDMSLPSQPLGQQLDSLRTRLAAARHAHADAREAVRPLN